VLYETYSGKKSQIHSVTRPGAQSDYWANPKSKNVLDRWVLSRLNQIIKEVTEKLDVYDITGAGRMIENFVVNDLSLWYIRRSRTRFQNPASAKDFKEASATLSFVLLQTSKLAAPFIPFLSEHIHGSLKAKGSVHWEDWPKPEKRDEKLEQEMSRVRDIVAKALAERAKAGIKVRQPLAKLKVKSEKLKILNFEL
jgi:isoleucyl-tRNA synthetase